MKFKNEKSQNQPVYIVSISAGENHVLAMDFDRNVWAWGSNSFNQINPYDNSFSFYYPKKLEHKVKLNDNILAHRFLCSSNIRFK